MMGESGEVLRIGTGSGVAGVYALLLQGVVVYCGKSTNVFARIGNHWQNMRRAQKGLRVPLDRGKVLVFDEVLIKQCAKRDLNREELELIQFHQPLHNEQLKRVAKDVRGSTAYQALLRKVEVQETREVKRRKLPPAVLKVEREFQTYRDPRMSVSLPKLRFMDEHAD